MGMVLLSPISSIGMQTFPGTGRPKEGEDLPLETSLMQRQQQDTSFLEEEVSAQLQAANSSYAIDSARDVQHQRQSLLCNIRHQ